MKNFINKAIYKLYKMFVLPNKITEKHNVFLVGTPEYGNLGDQMIAQAQIDFLKSMNIDFLEIPFAMYNKFKTTIPDRENNIILLQGGGNFGNEYKHDNEMRMEIVELYPKSRIILFPQTIYYTPDKIGEQKLNETIEIFSKHKNLTLCAREQVSYEKMKEHFKNNNVILVPDIVLSSDITPKTEIKKKQVLFLMRDDREKVDNSLQTEQIKSWAQQNGYSIKIDDTLKNYNISPLQREKELNKIFKTIQESELVVTDRLHGMIFSYISNVTVLVFTNYNHKVKSSFEWIKEGKVAFYQENLDISEFIENSKSKTNVCLMDKFTTLKEIIRK